MGAPLALAEARALAAEVRRQLAAGKDPAAAHVASRRRKVSADGTTFAAAAQKFVAESGSQDAALEGHRPHARARPGRSTAAQRARERWASGPVSEIDGHDVYALIEEVRRQGFLERAGYTTERPTLWRA